MAILELIEWSQADTAAVFLSFNSFFRISISISIFLLLNNWSNLWHSYYWLGFLDLFSVTWHFSLCGCFELSVSLPNYFSMHFSWWIAVSNWNISSKVVLDISKTKEINRHKFLAILVPLLNAVLNVMLWNHIIFSPSQTENPSHPKRLIF